MDQGRITGMTSILSLLFAVSAQAKDFAAVPGEFVVKLKPTTSIMSKANLNRTLGGQVKETVNKNERLVLVQRPLVELQASAVQSLQQNPMVEYAEPNFIYKVNGHRINAGASSLPNDTELGRLWGMINTGQSVEGDGGAILGRPGIDIDAKKAWEIETGSKEVVVAVIDTGVNYLNPDLEANIYTNEAEKNGQAGVDDDKNGCVDDVHGCDFANGDSDPMDVYGHGTHCGGTIGGVGNNNQGIVGVAWNVRLLPVRFLGDDGGGTLANAIKSIDYATAMKVTIMSNSWGGGGFSQALMDSIIRAKDAGILFIAAAGNSANDNDSQPEYPAGYLVDNVMAVAAIDPTGALADFSNFGKSTVHIAAPGVNVLSYTMRGLESWSGTSMATPHVAGVAALVYSQDMTQSYLTVKNRLLSSARPLGTLRGKVATNGIVNAYYALTNAVAPADPLDPFNWAKDAQQVSTNHPYENKATQTWTFKVEGAKQVAIYFTKFETEAGYDKVFFKNAKGEVVGNMSGRRGEGFGPVVEGDTVTITFTSDDSVNAYGFDVGGVAYQ
jgi:thermitase